MIHAHDEARLLTEAAGLVGWGNASDLPTRSKVWQLVDDSTVATHPDTIDPWVAMGRRTGEGFTRKRERQRACNGACADETATLPGNGAKKPARQAGTSSCEEENYTARKRASTVIGRKPWVTRAGVHSCARPF